jgi:hypothetical protein
MIIGDELSIREKGSDPCFESILKREVKRVIGNR